MLFVFFCIHAFFPPSPVFSFSRVFLRRTASSAWARRPPARVSVPCLVGRSIVLSSPSFSVWGFAHRRHSRSHSTLKLAEMSRMASPGGGHSSTSLGVMTPVAFPPPRSSLFSGRNVEASTPQSNGKRSTKKASPVGSLPATSSSPVVGALSPRASPTPPESSSSSPPPPKDLDGSSPPPPPPSFLANSPSSPSRAPRGRNKKQQRELPGQKTLTLGSLTTSSTSTGNGARGRLAGLAGPSQNGNGALNNNNTTTTTATATPAKTAAKSKLLYAGLHAAAFPPLSAATGPAPKETSESDLIGGLPSLWEVYCTPDTKLPYFYNAISKHVQWHVPVPPKEYVDQFGPINIPGIGPLSKASLALVAPEADVHFFSNTPVATSLEVHVIRCTDTRSFTVGVS